MRLARHVQEVGTAILVTRRRRTNHTLTDPALLTSQAVSRIRGPSESACVPSKERISRRYGHATSARLSPRGGAFGCALVRVLRGLTRMLTRRLCSAA